jgi:hypothetical protein
MFIFSMATAKPEVDLSLPPDAILTPFQRQWCVLGTHKLNRSVTYEALLKFVVEGVGILAIPRNRCEL